MEIVEISKNFHPYFVGVQFHPEFKSRPLKPSPPFVGLMLAASGKKKKKKKKEKKNIFSQFFIFIIIFISSKNGFKKKNIFFITGKLEAYIEKKKNNIRAGLENSSSSPLKMFS